MAKLKPSGIEKDVRKHDKEMPYQSVEAVFLGILRDHGAE
jgi:hypothetical protein